MLTWLLLVLLLLLLLLVVVVGGGGVASVAGGGWQDQSVSQSVTPLAALNVYADPYTKISHAHPKRATRGRAKEPASERERSKLTPNLRHDAATSEARAQWHQCAAYTHSAVCAAYQKYLSQNILQDMHECHKKQDRSAT